MDQVINIQSKDLFITSTLQQTASLYLGFSVNQTITVAQKLHEASYINYICTDSKNLNQDSITIIRNYIYTVLGEKYLPTKEHLYFTSDNQYEAHEAIYPLDVNEIFVQLKNMKENVQKNYII
ncbi:DNA topoisomerase [Candidatus Erwinia haradaeae]|uniref:DNA topoisomerase n=1 Tax=Candidatus Erwinia haradaeae TaxID=1922217 RepID=UPI0039E52426